MKDKQKERAVLALRLKKMKQAELEKTDGALFMLQEVVQNIETAQMNVNVYEAMKQGDKVLSQLQKSVRLEDLERIADNMQEQRQIQEQQMELFGHVLNEEDLLDDLNKLEADMYGAQLPEAAVGGINKVIIE